MPSSPSLRAPCIHARLRRLVTKPYEISGLVTGPGIVIGRKGNVGSIFWCDDDYFVIDTAYFVTSSLLPLRFLFYVLPTLNFINSDAAVPGLSRNQAYTLKIYIKKYRFITR